MCSFESKWKLLKKNKKYARVAQLVEHDLAKVGVAGSSPVSRSQRKQKDIHSRMSFCFSGSTGTRRFEVYAPLFRTFDSVESDFSLPT